MITSSLIPSTPIYQQIQNDKKAGYKIWLLFGLSANPIHLGHINYLHIIASILNPDRVLVIPAKVNPWKNPHDQCTAEQKLKMVRLATKSHPEWSVETIELERKGLSYTFQTIEALSQKIDQHVKLCLLLTDETASTFHKWNHVESILKHAYIVYGVRTEDTKENFLDDESIPKNVRKALQDGALPICNPPHLQSISSTQIRELCHSFQGNQLLSKLTPLVGDEVAQMIVDEKIFSS